MADLDDFFAKKDKKKKSKKFVTANTEVLATKLEESARRDHEAEVKAVSAAMTLGDTAFKKDHVVPEGNDDEWKEYEEFKKDYTGLKIDTLKLDENAGGGDDDDETELNEAGEKVRVKRTDGGPWSKIASANKSGDDEDDDDEADQDLRQASPEPHATESVTSGPPKSVYVPPQKRGGPSASSSSAPAPSPSSRTQGRRNKAAPDISNEMNFPSLAAAVADVGASKGGSAVRSEAAFERVKAGGGAQHSKTSDAPKLMLDNKYAALRGDH